MAAATVGASRKSFDFGAKMKMVFSFHGDLKKF
jgi:hypothetical protein